MDNDRADKPLEVFISHSSKDVDVAEPLIELIRAALDVPHKKIRCTSIDGYRLPTGASINEHLQREVLEAKCFIALLTPYSMQSAYVLFELGARWGAKLAQLPLLAKGLKPSSLRMPLSALNVLSCSYRAQLQQFLHDLGTELSRPLNAPSVYERYLDRFQGIDEPKPTEIWTIDLLSDETRLPKL